MSKQKKFACIISDPPYELNQRGNYGAHKHYNVESIERIKSMPISDLCEENAHFWLWIPTNLLEYGYQILRSYGFTPRSLFSWVKPRMGLGVYLRNATEHVIFGTRGKAPVKFKGQPNWGFFPLQDHSHKPEEFHKIVERVSPGPYLELFARRKFPGWSVWGNQVESDIEVPGFPVPNSPETRKKLELKGGTNA